MAWVVYGAVAFVAYRWLTAAERKKSSAKRARPADSRVGTHRPRRTENPYAVLEVDPRADLATIRRAYQAKVRACHPDLVHVDAAPAERAAAEAETKRLNVAYDAIRRELEAR